MHFCQANRKSFWQECVGADLSSSLRLKVLTRKRTRAHKHTDGGRGRASERERDVTQSAPWNSVENQLNNILGFALQTVLPWQSVKTAWQLLSTNYLYWESFPPFKCWYQLHWLPVSSYFPPGTEFPSSRFTFVVKIVRYVKREENTNMVLPTDEHQSYVTVQVTCSTQLRCIVDADQWQETQSLVSLPHRHWPLAAVASLRDPLTVKNTPGTLRGNHQSLGAHAFTDAKHSARHSFFYLISTILLNKCSKNQMENTERMLLQTQIEPHTGKKIRVT